MKRYIASVVMILAILFASIASAKVYPEFVFGIQGSYANVRVNDTDLGEAINDFGNETGELFCDSRSCAAGTDLGWGLYAQALANTTNGHAFGVHLGYSQYALETDISGVIDTRTTYYDDESKPSVETHTETVNYDVDYNANVIDILGIYRWNFSPSRAIFIMAGYSEYDADDFKVDLIGESSKGTLDSSGYKLIVGWNISAGPVVFSPAISYADYGNHISTTIIRIGLAYKFD